MYNMKILKLPLLLFALAFVLLACERSEELDTLTAPVVINAASAWSNPSSGDTRAVKEDFALGDVITLTYDEWYYYRLTSTGWVPVGEELRIPIDAYNPKGAAYHTGTPTGAGLYDTLSAPETPFTYDSAAKTWTINFTFAHVLGAVDLTLLDEELSPLDPYRVEIICNNTTAIITDPTVLASLKGIILSPGNFTEIKAYTNSGEEYTAILNENNIVVAGHRHPMTVILAKQ